MNALRRLFIALALFAPAVAFAQNAPGSAQVLVTGILNCNATNITSGKDCEIRNLAQDLAVAGTAGYNVMTLNIFYDWGTSGTGFSFTLQGCSEGMAASNCTDATDWYTIVGDQFTAATGVLTLKEATATYAAGADAYFAWTLGINQPRLRLHNVTAAAGTADKITVTAILTKTGAF